VLKTAIQELNEFEINEHYQLQVELIKENKQYFVIAECVPRRKHLEVINNFLQKKQVHFFVFLSHFIFKKLIKYW
jgi:ornithine carbamoyltransferase